MQSLGQLTLHDRLQMQSTDATNSEADPSDSLLFNNNSKFMQRVYDRFKHSLIGGLLRKSNAITEGHNVDNSEAPDAQLDKAGADTEGGGGGQGELAVNKKKKKRPLSEAAAARKRAETFYTVDTEAYDFKSVLDYYTKEDKRILPKSMKFLIGGGGGGSGSGSCVHPLLDKVVLEFCRRIGMQEVAKMPVTAERMFLWFGRDRAQRMLGEIGNGDTGEQVYFVNRVNLDHVITDLQCLCTRLGGCVARDGQSYPPHCCTDPNKIREQHKGPHSTPPRVAFIERQVLCRHVYLKQDFGIACEVKGCPNYGKRLCTCFQLDMFLPDTIVLATKRKFEEVRANLTRNLYGDQRWLIRASNLKGGNGVQLIDTVAELETFMRYDAHKKMRGQFFVLQRHLKNPLLLENKRFDLRMFMLVCVLTDRRVVAFLHPGYIRLAQRDYDATSNDLRCHLTWPFTWDPDYNRYKKKGAPAAAAAATAGSPADAEQQQEQQQEQKQQEQQQLPDYCRPYTQASETLGLPRVACDRALDAAMRAADGDRFLHRLGRIVHYLAGQIDSIVGDKPGTWQLFGLDLMLDADREVWLHDVMSYPSQDEPDPRSDTQNRLVPAVLTESLALVMELNQRDRATRSNMQWLDLPDVPVNQPGLIAAQKNFVWMYSTDTERLISRKPQRQRTKSLPWYNRWRVTEDFNDYILYLKNYRMNHIPLDADATLYGRKSFEHSPAEKFRQHMKMLRMDSLGPSDGAQPKSAQDE